MSDTASPDLARKAAGAPRVRRLLGAAPNVVLIVLAVLGGWLLWPSSLGGCTTLTIVNGHSMEPTYVTGDLVLSRCGDAAVGDVIVYQPESTGGARIIHRIIGGSAADGWEMQGDNNDFVDPFYPQGAEVVGVAQASLPKVGLAAATLTSPLLWLSAIALAIALLLWPRSGDDGDESDSDADDVPAGAELETAPEPVHVPGVRVRGRHA